MDSEVHIFAVDGTLSVRADRQSLVSLGLTEVAHLERWVVDHPEILGDGVLIVTTQYDRWSSSSGDRAKERLDILGLDVSGQLVVVELKRGSDSKIHLQAITYASLVAGFSEESLVEAHAEYLSRAAAAQVSAAEARVSIVQHVEEGVALEETLRVPRIVLIAEQFSAQTYTTVSWLADVAPNLTIELHTANAFRFPDQEHPNIVFRRLYPVDDPDRLVLTPTAAALESAAAGIAERNKRRRSTVVLFEADFIPAGSPINLELAGVVNAKIVQKVQSWVAEDPRRGQAVWVSNRSAPLQWCAGDDGGMSWAPTPLASHIIQEATGEFRDAIPGADVWFYEGRSLFELAKDADA